MGSGEGLIIFYILYFIFYILRINTFLHFVDLFIEYQVKSSRVIGRQVHLYYICEVEIKIGTTRIGTTRIGTTRMGLHIYMYMYIYVYIYVYIK